MMKTTLAINGACGRMGQRLVHLATRDPELVVGAALEYSQSPSIGKDIGEVCGLGPLGVAVRSDLALKDHVDVVIDFSTPEGTQSALKICRERKLPVVIATTGHTAEEKAEIAAAAHHIAVLMAPNMSLAVNVLFALTQQAARLLAGKDFDVEVIERHHRFKKDAPSGTALHFARIVQEAMGGDLRHGREGLTGERPRQEIGMHALRVGDNVGEHTIVFSTIGETLELVHKGHNRDSYARGALLAAKFLAGKPAGQYTMQDVLGL
jgi:4-hydroxy-tetrahydrodipicolinate reductase